MREYVFHVLNVFAEMQYGGNPLAVFEDARGLSDADMFALTDQFNYAETTFIYPPESGGTAKVRIISPGYEMKFAGHPALGTAHVVRQVMKTGDRVTLELPVGHVDLTAKGDHWEFQSPPYTIRQGPDNNTIAHMLGVRFDRVNSGPRWVSTGSEQLIIPMVDAESVEMVKPVYSLLSEHSRNASGHIKTYVFARTRKGYVARFFWEQDKFLREDPGTGSACANLGSWLAERGLELPIDCTVEQGHHVKRPNLLSLRVDVTKRVYVGGRVWPLMRGVATLD